MFIKKISVIGCGWLGLPLAKELTDNYEVYGSTTTDTKLERLKELGIRPVLLEVDNSDIRCDDKEIWTAHVFIIAIPPGIRAHGEDYHVRQMSTLLTNISEEVPIIYISSTSVYPSAAGNYNEFYNVDLDNTGNATLYRAERLVSERENSTILRCGGLMGMNRIAGRYFAGKEAPGAKQPVNYIHHHDAVHIIIKVIKGKITGTYNLVCPEHPSRREVYKANAEQFGFKMPTFIDDGVSRDCKYQ
jgi:nucleoside-diphosphate-sugar epimerase